jgi:MFS family permease
MVGLVAIMISTGYVFSNWLGVAFYFVQAGGAQWRIPIAICTLPSVLVLCLLPLIPESLRWLVMKSRNDDAHRVLLKLHGDYDDEGQEFAELELKQMVDQIAFEKENKVTWWALFTSPRYRVRTVLTFLT